MEIASPQLLRVLSQKTSSQTNSFLIDIPYWDIYPMESNVWKAISKILKNQCPEHYWKILQWGILMRNKFIQFYTFRAMTTSNKQRNSEKKELESSKVLYSPQKSCKSKRVPGRLWKSLYPLVFLKILLIELISEPNNCQKEFVVLRNRNEI